MGLPVLRRPGAAHHEARPLHADYPPLAPAAVEQPPLAPNMCATGVKLDADLPLSPVAVSVAPPGGKGRGKGGKDGKAPEMVHCSVTEETGGYCSDIRTKVFRIGAPLLRTTIP